MRRHAKQRFVVLASVLSIFLRIFAFIVVLLASLLLRISLEEGGGVEGGRLDPHDGHLNTRLPSASIRNLHLGGSSIFIPLPLRGEPERKALHLLFFSPPHLGPTCSVRLCT
jgi:hypothetical protein